MLVVIVCVLLLLLVIAVMSRDESRIVLIALPQGAILPDTDGSPGPTYNLNEMRQDTQDRSMPEPAKTDFVKDGWKVAQSHPYYDQIGRAHTSFSSDQLTPVRNNTSMLQRAYKRGVTLPNMWLTSSS